MKLFGRKKLFGRQPRPELLVEVPEGLTLDEVAGPKNETAEVVVPETGPFDISQQPELGARVDLGAIRLPVLPGAQVRMEIDRASKKVTGVTVIHGPSSMQLQAFAAPRTAGIWDEIRAEIAAGVQAQGGKVDDVPGTFGRELLARVPGKTKDGRDSLRPVRFVGADGNRWFLRGVLTGKAAIDPTEAEGLESVFANVVVERDNTPRPPRDLLPLTLPGQALPKTAAEAESDAPSFDPLTRGPEMTETR